MKKALVVAAFLAVFANAAFADATCDSQAADKKLAGAAKASFLKKCNADSMADAKNACTAQAADKKLNGAAKNSFVTKCVKDSAAPAAK
jgi:hypothetical protein